MSITSGRAPHHSTARVCDDARPATVTAPVTTRWAGATVRRTAAALRIVLGSIFLWAFADKLLALGHDTGKDPVTGVTRAFGPAAWVHGASPTTGFLQHASGPLAPAYRALAGHALVDLLFMTGLLAIGLGLVLGVALRPVAVAGGVLLVLMWGATLPPANNPLLDDHLVDALALGLLAALDAGRTWGLGGHWASLATVRRHPVLR